MQTPLAKQSLQGDLVGKACSDEMSTFTPAGLDVLTQEQDDKRPHFLMQAFI